MTSEENPPVDDTAPAATEDAENPEVGDANPPKSGEPGPFALEVDPQQQYKAKELKICSFARPHMRAFHYSWWSFFIAFFIWFSAAPLLPEIRISLDLNNQQIWLSNIIDVSCDDVMRFVFGSLTYKWGSRI
jgi:NNP family nitrate/nitrite transporter-like MFS transporter